MIGKKRYIQRRAETLLTKLVTVAEMPVAQARRVFAELLAARVGEVVEVGVTLEVRHALRHDATDDEIAAWQQQVSQRLLDDVQIRKTHRVVGQGISLESALITTTAQGIQFEVSGELGDLLAMQAYLLARTVGRERLRQCACGKVFVRTGRREYCSERCQKRFYMRRVRASEAGREEGT